MNTDDDKKKRKKEKKEKEEIKIVENDYPTSQNNDIGDDFSNFYNTSDSYETDNQEEENNSDKGKLKKIIIIIILAVILAILIFVLIMIIKKSNRIPPEINLSSNYANSWSKDNITIDINNPSNASIKYTINCDNKCDYVDVTDNKITITNDGTSKVTIIAKGSDGAETKKDITVSIDRVAPNVTLSPNNTKITSSEDVTVCAICTDNESGCKEEQVCKTYKSSAKNQKLTVYDNAGNSRQTAAFAVTINKSGKDNNKNTDVTPKCSLGISGNNIIAKHSDATYYGFSSSYSGSNEGSKALPSTGSGEKTYTYYVKNSSSGKTNTCSLKVGYSCNCSGMRGDDGKCYKTFVKRIDDPNSPECANATRKDNKGCSFYKDEGFECKYSIIK